MLTEKRTFSWRRKNLKQTDKNGYYIKPPLKVKDEELVVQNLRRKPHSSVTIRRFLKQKSCCHVIAILSGWHRCPNLNCNAILHFSRFGCYQIAIKRFIIVKSAKLSRFFLITQRDTSDTSSPSHVT